MYFVLTSTYKPGESEMVNGIISDNEGRQGAQVKFYQTEEDAIEACFLSMLADEVFELVDWDEDQDEISFVLDEKEEIRDDFSLEEKKKIILYFKEHYSDWLHTNYGRVVVEVDR